MLVQENGFFRHIQTLNTWNPDNFRSFMIGAQRVGYIKDFMCAALTQWPDYFSITESRVDFIAQANSFETRSKVLDEVVLQLVEQGVIANHLDEVYAVTGSGRDNQLALLDRGASAYFGIHSYGQHMNGYVVTDEGLKLWVARRAADRVHYPNRLDNIVAGGLPQNISLKDNLLKECHEEANIPAELVKGSRAVGAVSYCCETKAGLKPDTLYCYDLQLPESFVPENTDGEVAEFQLMDLDSVISLVRDTDEFKTNCNLVLIDFFIRHGAIDPAEDEYLEIVSGLQSGI